MFDTCGAGAEDWDEQRKVLIPKDVRERRGRSVVDMLIVKPGLMKGTITATTVATTNSATEPRKSKYSPNLSSAESPDRVSNELNASAGLGADGKTKDKDSIIIKDDRGDVQHQQQQKINTIQREQEDTSSNAGKKIFTGLTIFVNGSTFPLVSDHRLRKILIEHGANMSMHLGRRKVTHVILGQAASGGGAGGGLAGGKLDKEIAKLRGCGLKFVGVEW